RTVRSIGFAVVGVVAAWGGFEIWNTLHSDPHSWAATADTQPVRHVLVESDGVLDQLWVEDTLQLRRDVGLMELDLYALRAKLLEHGQVRTAVLKREFPDTLRVTLEERSPVVRLKARLDGPDVQDFLVARDGRVFLGQGHDPLTLSQLPWLGGVRLIREGTSFQPLEGLDRVADLIATARSNVPELFPTWRVVSLERFARDGQIVVQTTRVPEIVFGLREDFYTQIARLDLIL